MRYLDYLRRLSVFVVLLSVFSLSILAAEGEAEKILDKVSGESSEQVWGVGEELAALGEGVTGKLKPELASKDAGRVVAAAYALMKNGVQQEAVDALENLIVDSKVPVSRRNAAARLLGALGGEYASARIRTLLSNKKLASGVIGETLQAVLAASLLELTRGATSYEYLENIAKNSKSFSARAEAIIALGRTRKYADIKGELETLAKVPGAYGQAADAIISLNERSRAVEGTDRFTTRLLGEVIKDLRVYYAPDETDEDEMKQLEARNMAEMSAKAILKYIDPFNDYFTEEDLASFEEQMHNNYSGIGAWVGMRNGRFTILTPMFGQPAYKAGIVSMDIVEKVDGKDLKGLDLNDIIKLLKGPPDTKVKLTIWRSGMDEPRDFVVTRQTIKIPPVLSQKLPGNIGYVRLTNFTSGDRHEGIKDATDMLREEIGKFVQDGAKGIVLDLSNNPGGLLPQAVGIARLFIGDGKMIVFSKGKDRVYPRREFRAGSGKPFYEGPLVVLVNGGSASASEIVAGALKDNKRAKLVGTRTFGKGSVQQIMNIRTTGTTCIKLTVAKYYLPSGKCIHGPYKKEGGIAPDVEAKEPEIKLSEFNRLLDIRDSHEIEKWLDERFKKYEKEYRQMVEFDNYDWKGYPEFDDLYKMLCENHPKANLDRETVRQELRFALINYLRNHLGEERHVDVQESHVMMRGLLELEREIPGGLGDVPLYAKMREVIAAEDAKAKEMDEKKKAAGEIPADE